MKHIALSSAFLLSFRCDLKRHPALLQSVEALIDAFALIVEDRTENGFETLTEPHLRSLGILRQICSRNFPEDGQGIPAGGDFDGELAPMNPHEAPVADAVDSYGITQASGSDQMFFQTPRAGLDSFWDDEFFSLLTGNANIASNDILDEPWSLT